MAKKFDFLSPGIEIREIDQSFIGSERDAEGPIIIGRTRKGPANKPVKVRNLDDFVSVFGLPVPGGNGVQGDMWRDGNMTGPTYASYAAQAWLASEEAPVTIVRLSGEQKSGATGFGEAGWNLAGTPTNVISTNSTAYGLFLVASGAAVLGTGSLAAVFYANEGYVALAGTRVTKDLDASTVAAAAFMKSVGSNCEFKLNIYNAASTLTDELVFNFNRNSSKYLRSVFSTNPQLTNTVTVEAAQTKSYWLGESFARELSEPLLSADTGEVYGIILALQSGSAATGNWGSHRESAAEAQSGYVICQKEKTQQDMFRFKSLHVGEEIEKNYMIAIEQIAEPGNPIANAFGSFTVAIKNLAGQTVERYVGCNLNPSSADYLAKRIGDQYQEWSDTDRRYRTYGDFQNQSDIIYVDMKQFIKDGGGQGLLPAGFKGPVRPKGFAICSGSTQAMSLPTMTSQFVGAFIKGSGSIPGVGETSGGPYRADSTGSLALGPVGYSASFSFPSIPLRASGIEGGAADPYRAYYGIRPTISSTSTTHDPDYCDYLRRLPTGTGVNGSFTPGADFELSFTFTLDDIVIDTTANTVTYTDASYVGNTSYSVLNSFGALLNKNVRQFLMPIHGGFEGWDITEKEPLRDDLIGTTRNDSTNYLQYTMNKALDSVLDPEVVPSNLLVMPGIKKPLITNRIISVAESRKDTLAIIDLENDYTPIAERDTADTDSNSLGSVTSAVSSLKTRNLNSSYAAAFYPWVQVSDNLNGGQLVWLPSSVAGLGAMAKSQATSELWFAPAGFNRGGLGSLGGSRGPRVLQARQRLDSKERDSLYEVNINPIATFPAEGVVIFGQKTLQADASALDRINVRRLVLFLKSKVSAISRNLLFDQNVQSTWNRFKSQVNPVLSDVQSRFGLSDYKLILDDTTTTADLIDRNIMYAKIYIKPARAIEYIVVDFVITKTGADFV